CAPCRLQLAVPMDTGDRLTWTQRRELERELWLDDHLRALSEVVPEDLDDPEMLRAIESRARGLAETVAKLPDARRRAGGGARGHGVPRRGRAPRLAGGAPHPGVSPM